jgi:predicted GNAT superfamily acetyltransferase
MSATVSDEITIRPLQSLEDYRRCVALQYEIWGDDFEECAPPSLLMATQQVAGVAAGAFDADGELLGFVFGIGGLRDGRPVHWSDMLGVRAGHRDLGLGRRLKAHQREYLLENGISVAYWTYDPLEARNAHVNINRLGARPVEYVPDMYGEIERGSLLSGLSTDRFIVEWELDHPRTEAALAGKSASALSDAPVVNSEMGEEAPVPQQPALPDVGEVRIEVPADLHAVKNESLDVAKLWRETTRRAFTYYMDRGYLVTGFQCEAESGRCFYLLELP